MPNTATAIQLNEFDEFFALECWQEDRQPVLQEEQTAHIQDSRLACLIAGMQESRIAVMLESVNACYPNILPA